MNDQSGLIWQPSRPLPFHRPGTTSSTIFWQLCLSFSSKQGNSLAFSPSTLRITTSRTPLPSFTAPAICFFQSNEQMFISPNSLSRSSSRTPPRHAGESSSARPIRAKGVRQSILCSCFSCFSQFFSRFSTFTKAFWGCEVSLLHSCCSGDGLKAAWRAKSLLSICFMSAQWSLLSSAFLRLRLRQLASFPKLISLRGKPSWSTSPCENCLVQSISSIWVVREAISFSIVSFWAISSFSSVYIKKNINYHAQPIYHHYASSNKKGKQKGSRNRVQGPSMAINPFPSKQQQLILLIRYKCLKFVPTLQQIVSNDQKSDAFPKPGDDPPSRQQLSRNCDRPLRKSPKCGLPGQVQEKRGDGTGGGSCLRRRDEAANRGQRGWLADRAGRLQDIRMRLCHRLQLLRDRADQGHECGGGPADQEQRYRLLPQPASREAALLDARRGGHQKGHWRCAVQEQKVT